MARPTARFPRGARVLVTGAAGGIGAATCEELAGRGAEVTGADLDASDLSPSCRRAWALDVTDDAAIAALAREVGPLDGLVLSHGVTSLGPAMQTPMRAVDRVLAVNLRGAIAVTQALLPALVHARGRVVVLSSVSGFAPLVNRTAYAAAKHGVHGYFDSLRSELAPSGVSVTVVAPSFVATGIEDRAAYRADGAGGTWSTTGEVLEPRQVAEALVGGMARRRRLVLPSATARRAYVLSRLAPAVYERVMRRRVLA